jgi:hypothetical protein
VLLFNLICFFLDFKIKDIANKLEKEIKQKYFIFKEQQQNKYKTSKQ